MHVLSHLKQGLISNTICVHAVVPMKVMKWLFVDEHMRL